MSNKFYKIENKKKVLLIKPKTYLESSIISSAESVLPPLGILYIGAAIKKAGHKTLFVDLDLESQPIESFIEKFNPDWIGMTSTTPSFPYAMEIARRIKKISSAPIVLGGVHGTSVGAKLLEKYPEIDFIIKGEGEQSIVDLIEGKSFEKIPGLCYKDTSGVIFEKNLAFINDLNSLEFPDRTLIEKYEYRDSPLYRRTDKHSTILFTRGCVYKCIFCDHQTRGNARFRSADNILKELKSEYERGINDFRILDEFFTMNKPLVKKVCQEIIDSKMKITWNCQTRADALDEDMIILMKKAGCWNVQIGVETGSKDVMEKIHKKLDLDRVVETCKLLKKHEIFTVAFFMMGFPFETKEDIQKTVSFAKKIDPHMVTFSMVTPYPATELWPISGLDEFDEATLKSLGIFSNKNYFLKDVDMTSTLSRAIRDFYFRPKAASRLFKEACLHGSLKRRSQYLKSLIQGSTL
ncbi:MAG: B12-binding domain-containing radical SAM protein [Candidatus Woesearchaeota archaeon]